MIDSQNNPLFRGVPLEQAYSYRGGLCQAGADDVVVLPGTMDPGYLAYWRDTVGLPLPSLLYLNNKGDAGATTSQLLLQDSDSIGILRRITSGKRSRLEFFCVGEDERVLARMIGIAPYVHFDTAIEYAEKSYFKPWWARIGVPTPNWRTLSVNDGQSGVQMNGTPVLLKFDEGTGGVLCGGATLVRSDEEFEQAMRAFAVDERTRNGTFIAEDFVQGGMTLSVHWEVLENHELRFIGIFYQEGELAYTGVSHPVAISCDLEKSLKADVEVMYKSLPAALGYFCGDVVIDKAGNRSWVDFNPRKGAIIYIYDAVRRIADVHGWELPPFFHRHLKLPWMQGRGFAALHDVLGPLLVPRSGGFVLVTNSGVFPHGYADITGIGPTSDRAKEMLELALERLLPKRMAAE